MKQSVFWNRRSGRDRRYKAADANMMPLSDERRVIDRRLYGDNGYVLIVGNSGIDRFTLMVMVPAMVSTVVALVASSLVYF